MATGQSRLLVRFDARPGKENELAGYLRAGLARVQQNPDSASWFAIRFGPAKFAIFDVFTERGRMPSPFARYYHGNPQGKIRRTVGAAAGDRKSRRNGGQAGRLRLKLRKFVQTDPQVSGQAFGSGY